MWRRIKHIAGEIRAVCIPVGTANQSSIKLSLSLSFSPFFSTLSKTGQWERVGTRLSMMYEIFELGGGDKSQLELLISHVLAGAPKCIQ